MTFATAKQIEDLHSFTKTFNIKNKTIEEFADLTKGCLEHQLTISDNAQPMSIEHYDKIITALKNKYSTDTFEGRVLRAVVTDETIIEEHKKGFDEGVTHVYNKIEELLKKS